MTLAKYELQDALALAITDEPDPLWTVAALLRSLYGRLYRAQASFRMFGDLTYDAQDQRRPSIYPCSMRIRWREMTQEDEAVCKKTTFGDHEKIPSAAWTYRDWSWWFLQSTASLLQGV